MLKIKILCHAMQDSLPCIFNFQIYSTMHPSSMHKPRQIQKSIRTYNSHHKMHEMSNFKYIAYLNVQKNVQKGITLTIATANEAGMKENAILTIIEAENASKSYKKDTGHQK